MLVPDGVEGAVVNVGWEGVGVTGHIPDNIGVSRHTPTEEGVATPFRIIVAFKRKYVWIDCRSWNIAFTALTVVVIEVNREFALPDRIERAGNGWRIGGKCAASLFQTRCAWL